MSEPTRNARIAIVGGGLSGLYAAWLLERRGLRDYLLLEARSILGGRILSVDASSLVPVPTDDRFDMGPTWFWPDHQQVLHDLVTDLGLRRFEQYETGDTVVEPAPGRPPVRMRGYASSPASFRLVGGMAALVDALHRALDPARIVTGQAVRRLSLAPSHITLHSEDVAGRAATWRADQVLLAMPPRLAEHTIAFAPAMPWTLAQSWRQTATWMAPHAKYIALYEAPFWREQGLSGEGRSACGPMTEIHDASMPGGSAALFGFLGVPATARRRMTEQMLRSLCRAQFVRLFGPLAATPKAEFLKDWAQDPYTATAADQLAQDTHAPAPHAYAADGPWRGRLTGIASEWSPHFPGYVAGAVEAASLAVQALQE
ncbi:FAD-dependent oxidoreductase [Bordetella sp. FB-8]|uniref:flavin monoamine oxidase family protein n=1 Tax=Bordetella sp. FB-8 TaxID=1159870 RepID=UPI0003820B99|nr:FAD-dependent oxidoreductase [Bordetella sp. FB-8]